MTNDVSVLPGEDHREVRRLLRAFRELAGRAGPGVEPARRAAAERRDPLRRPADTPEG
ncbi:hypothetical protein [Kitasatospora sp. NPDC015120]|uniref:hypothetical protein n=1 Tax=Kitasatospora sp. NPDC015120 TaxID=3364023 RepID=UPI0036F49845